MNVFWPMNGAISATVDRPPTISETLHKYKNPSARCTFLVSSFFFMSTLLQYVFPKLVTTATIQAHQLAN